MNLSRAATVAAAILLLGPTTSCDSGPAAPGVPALAGGASGSGAAGDGSGAAGDGSAAAGDGSAARRARLLAAAQCIRDHGAPRYQDPVLTADGRVYTDTMGIRDVDEAKRTAIDTACGELIRAAGFAPADQAPPPPKLVQAGVRSADCLRNNGLPDYPDPTAETPFVPGKGFGLDSEGLPAGGKGDPGVRRAVEACRRVLDEEAALSSLGNLGNA